jgi:dipeptidyl aminopeptidase/acylaminoacyl peptidase
MIDRTPAACAAGVVSRSAAMTATRPRPFVPDDILDFKILADVQLSPDGERVAYELRTVDKAQDDDATRLFVLGMTGGEPRPWTSGQHRDKSPRWSPDGRRMAFVSARAGTQQLFVIDVDGGEARQITTREHGAMKGVWSPDGRELLFLGRVPVEERPPDVPAERWRQRPRVITHASYKVDGVGYMRDDHIHVFRVPADGGEARQLTSGPADHGSPAWSPDGRAIAFTRTRTHPGDSHRTDLWRMDKDGGGLRRLTDDISKVQSPAWSPDGRTIAFFGSRIDGDARTGVWLIDADGGAPRRLGGDDLEVASYTLSAPTVPCWQPDGRHLLVLRAEQGTSHVTRIAVDTGKAVRIIDGERQIAMFSLAPAARRIAFVCFDGSLHCELWACHADGREPREIHSPNAAWSADRIRFEVHRRSFRAGRDQLNLGWLMLPCDRGVRPLPLWVDVHGGPLSHVSLGFPYHPYWHMLVSRGWAVLALDAVGSGSYGEKFAERLRGHWGERDLPEHLAAIDSLVEEGVVDTARVVIGGKSYGGYLAAWAIGQTRRFCAAVVSAPVANHLSHFGTSDSGYYVTPFALGGDPWVARAAYEQLSPVYHLDKATTPTLILQGEEDQRCPVGQAEEVFAALVRVGKAPTEFVRYPGGSHHLLEEGTPSHRVDYNRRIVAWAERWANHVHMKTDDRRKPGMAE